MIDLSIVIVNWNTRDLLIKCLESVYAGTEGLSFEVIVVDNASIDGSAEAARQRFPHAQLIENTENVGFARANNQAIHVSNGHYIMLLNSDTEAYPGAIQKLIEFLDAHPDVGAVGPCLLNPDGTLQPSCNPMPTLFREFWRLFHLDTIALISTYNMRRWGLEQARQVDTVQGACMMLRREALAAVGVLDEAYFMYSEEIDLCFRLHQAGLSVYWVPGARVIHYGGQSSQQASAKMFLQLYYSKYLFFQKTQGKVSGLFYKFILLGASIARIALSPLAYGLPETRRAQIFVKVNLYKQLIASLPAM